MKRICLVLLLTALTMALAGGCASRVRPSASNSFLAEDFPAGAVPAVAEHLADMLVAAYPPGYTSFFLGVNGPAPDGLGLALDAALRSRGFTVVPENGGQALVVVYILDRLDEANWYSRVTLSDGLTVTRAWTLNGEALSLEAATRTSRAEGLNGQK